MLSSPVSQAMDGERATESVPANTDWLVRDPKPSAQTTPFFIVEYSSAHLAEREIAHHVMDDEQ